MHPPMRDRSVLRRWSGLVLAGVVPFAVFASTTSAASVPHDPRYDCRVAVTKVGNDISITYRMQSEVVGQTWHVRLWDNDVRFFSKDRTTNAQGRFTVVKATEDRKGPDHVRANATNVHTDKVCAVHITI